MSTTTALIAVAVVALLLVGFVIEARHQRRSEFQRQLRAIKRDFEHLQIVVGEQLVPAMRAAGEAVNEFVRVWRETEAS